MEIIRNTPTRLRQWPVDGNGSDIQAGAVLMPGVTDENNRSVLILATSAGADAVGLLAELHDTSVSGDSDPDAGTVYAKRGVQEFEPGCEVAAELADDSSNDVDVASYSSGTVTISSLEDDIDGSWLYVRDGAGVGQLLYIKESASGSCVIKNTTGVTALDSTSKVLILRRLFHQLVELDSTGTKITSTAAAGNLPWRVLGHQFKYQGQESWIDLDPTKHHAKQLSGLSPKFRLILSPANTLKNPID